MSNSDGWYDHLTGPIHNASATGNVAGQDDTDTNANDSLIPVLPLSMSANPGDIPTTPLASVGLPPWAKTNFVDHTLTDQTSSLRFIEGNRDLESVDPLAGLSERMPPLVDPARAIDLG